jgi:hypothetical protein
MQPQTQIAHDYVFANQDLMTAFPYAAPFFIPLGKTEAEREYSPESRSLTMAIGLRHEKNTEEIVRSVYSSAAAIGYYQASIEHQRMLARFRKLGNKDAILLENRTWDIKKSSYLASHPAFRKTMFSQESKARRIETVEQFEVILADPSLIPEDTPHRGDILTAMSWIVQYHTSMERLFGLTTIGARDKRNQIRHAFYIRFVEAIKNRKHLHPLYYNLFVPMIGESWIVKLEEGQFQSLGLAA